MQDILKFGVDKLFQNDDSSVEDLDLDAVLGRSKNGVWQTDETAVPTAEVRQREIKGLSAELLYSETCSEDHLYI